ELWNCDIYRRNAGLKLSVFGQNFETDIVEERQMDLENPLGPGVNYYRVNLAMPEHRRWEPESPWLYQLQARLHDEDGELLDTSAQQFGMRSFRMGRDEDREGRMYLNGREIRLRGANTMGFEQQDVMREDWDQLVDDILLAKVCNMNYWRLTQRPVQEEVYEYCDRLGLMTQTDLPLFGVLRRNQFCEAVRQAEEMERLVRAHPCNIMDTYINEPFPEARGKQHRHLAREELERFFSAADKAVYQANPDRVIKPVDGDYDPPAPGLPDNHCYCGWYNGHGVDIGRLHRGFWQQVKAGWMYGCGEFGAEGLEDAGLMRRHYPEEWLPQTPEEEAEWSPGEIVRAQTGRFHYMWFDAQQSVEDWVETSQEHQAWATRIMTEAFRRDERMNSFAIHLFIDAFPSGWMKAIMDVERRPKKAFYVYRDLLKPLIVSLRADRTRFFGGEMAAVEAWICNDTHKDHPGARLAYRVEMDEQTIGGGSTEARVPECSSRCQGKIQFELPPVKERKTAVLRLALIDSAGTVLHHTCQELDVFADPEIDLSSRRLVVVGSPSGPSARLVRALGAAPEMIEEWDESAPDPSATTVLVDSVEDYHRLEKRLTTWVENGAVVVLVEPEEGEHRVAGTDIGVIPCGMGHRHFVSRATGHPLVQGFEPDDFKFWYDARVGYKTPLLETTFTAKGWAPILTSGNGGFKTDRWRKTLAAAELPRGAGRWRICNLRLADRIQDNPVAETFAQRLLLAR
ncbi:MAG: glycoside hydrolase family 2 TIM barrel-domain containing protein, partial [Candidatus Brocadiia bacterium]